MPRPLRCGFTLVELLVVIAIIGILIGMLVPAVQSMRELSRRSGCEQKLVKLSLGLAAYSTQFGHYPIGSVNPTGPIKSEAVGFHHNWITGLLPMLDARNVYNAIDRSVSVYADENRPVRDLALPMLRCPSATDTRDYTTCYAGITSSMETPIAETNDGVFLLNRPVADDDITDGLSYTLFIGEKLSHYEEDLGWISGTRSSLRNTGHPINAERNRIRGPQAPGKQVGLLYVGGLASDHLDGAYLLMGSGQYDFRSSSMDLRVLQQMASRADGKLPIEWEVKDGGSQVKAGAGQPAGQTSDDLTL
jgi:prepilin-type N-terminal cleavage/methylation domain-containing protein